MKVALIIFIILFLVASTIAIIQRVQINKILKLISPGS